MSASALYQQVVLDHYRHPRHRVVVDGFTHAADGANPLCGDRLRVEVTCEGDRIARVGFTGEACAIATASGSMLGDLVGNMRVEEIVAMAERFRRMIESGDADDDLGELNAMRELQRHPGRRQCALLPWAALCAALAGDQCATTELEKR